jgi:hypothetical protein
MQGTADDAAHSQPAQRRPSVSVCDATWLPLPPPAVRSTAGVPFACVVLIARVLFPMLHIRRLSGLVTQGKMCVHAQARSKAGTSAADGRDRGQDARGARCGVRTCVHAAGVSYAASVGAVAPWACAGEIEHAGQCAHGCCRPSLA